MAYTKSIQKLTTQNKLMKPCFQLDKTVFCSCQWFVNIQFYNDPWSVDFFTLIPLASLLILLSEWSTIYWCSRDPHVCALNGNNLPTLCCCSESGSITAELLVKMLAQMDSLELFDRSEGINPFLILDGHGSQFDCSFLDYINSPLTHPMECVYRCPLWNLLLASRRFVRAEWTFQNGTGWQLQSETYLPKRLNMICHLLLRNLTLLPLFQLPGKKGLQIKEQKEKQSQNKGGSSLSTITFCSLWTYRAQARNSIHHFLLEQQPTRM